MRFCMVSTYYPPYHYGGDGVFVQGLARALTAAGHQVEVVHCEDAFRLASRESSASFSDASSPENDGVIVHRLNNHCGPLSPLITQQTGHPGLKQAALRRIFARNFDVVNFHNISLVGGPGVLALSRAAVNLYTLHEHWLICPTHCFWKNRKEVCQVRSCIRCCLQSGVPPQLWRYSGLVRRALRHVDVLLSPSVYTARQHAEAGLGRPVRVLPTYAASVVDPSTNDATAPPARPRFLFAGRVTASKGVDWLVEQFSRLPQYDLDIVGKGDLLEELKRRYAACGWIRFRGAAMHSEMPGWYSGATALIVPSRAPEVFPLCILEAFACGTPAIASAAGGTPEAVETSGAGFVYRDQPGFLAAVAQLAEQPGLRGWLGERARAAYQRSYTEEKYVGAYLEIVDEILRTKRPERALATQASVSAGVRS